MQALWREEVVEREVEGVVEDVRSNCSRLIGYNLIKGGKDRA